jgi:hypothetical protein
VGFYLLQNFQKGCGTNQIVGNPDRGMKSTSRLDDYYYYYYYYWLVVLVSAVLVFLVVRSLARNLENFTFEENLPGCIHVRGGYVMYGTQQDVAESANIYFLELCIHRQHRKVFIEMQL